MRLFRPLSIRNMAASIITPDDLENFKQDLIKEIQQLISPKQAQRKWLKSNEVRRMLLISPGTLQNMRVNGILPFTKIGSVIFYDFDDIQKMLESRKRNPHALPGAKRKSSDYGDR